MDGEDNKGRGDVFAKAVRAGKRTYFFDVKATQSNDPFLVITESKRMMDAAGAFYFQKHKIFIYKEDFDKFSGGLQEALNFIEQEGNWSDCVETDAEPEETFAGLYDSHHRPGNDHNYRTDISFDDLEKEDR